MDICFHFLYLVLEFLYHKVNSYLTFSEIAKLFSKVETILPLYLFILLRILDYLSSEQYQLPGPLNLFAHTSHFIIYLVIYSFFQSSL